MAGAERVHAGAASVDRRSFEPGEVAWLAVLPCAAVVTLAMVLLGPRLGHALFEPGSERFWPEASIAPEPVEHARFVLALSAAPLMGAIVVASRRWPPRLRIRPARALIAAAQIGTVGCLALSLLAQYDIPTRFAVLPRPTEHLFTLPAIAAALALAVALAVIMQRSSFTARLMGIGRETKVRRVACVLGAGLLVAVWLSAGFNTEHTIGFAEANHLIPWDMNETFAVLDGRTPLVNYHSQYAQLLPYLVAGALRLIGTSVGAWTATMLTLSALALLAVYAVLRRVLSSSLFALLLFVPFLAGGASLISGRLSPLEIFSLWPMRYGGPYLLAWLTARHLDGVMPRRRWWLFVVGALVAINNLEFGLPALAGTFIALVYVHPPRSWQRTRRLLSDVVVGLLVAAILVSVLSDVRGGALPNVALLLEFPRIYGIGGWVLEPMAPIGFHLAVYLTFVGAIVVATVRAVRDDDGHTLTGMLAWSGVFGLGAGSYYAGRSDSINLVSLFSAWCFALSLLTVVAVRGLAAAKRRPTLPELAVLFGWGLAACAIFEMPRPWAELARIQQRTAPVLAQRAAVRLVARTTTRGDKVAILIPLGHRIAFDAGVVNVAPYSSTDSMPTENQLETTLAVMSRASIAQVYVDSILTYPAQLDALQRAGYYTASYEGRYLMLKGALPGR